MGALLPQSQKVKEKEPHLSSYYQKQKLLQNKPKRILLLKVKKLIINTCINLPSIGNEQKVNRYSFMNLINGSIKLSNFSICGK